jgi:hypothetical protein
MRVFFLKLQVLDAEGLTRRGFHELRSGREVARMLFLCLPLKPGSLHSDEKDSVGNLSDTAPIGVMQAGDLAFLTAPSFWSG